MARRDGNLLEAIIVSIVALFELCFTGKADRAWRLARADNSNNITPVGTKTTPAEHRKSRPGHHSIFGADGSPPSPSAPASLSRLSIVIAAAVLILGGILFSVESPDGQLKKLEDGVSNGASIQTPGTATEGQSSEISRAAKIAGVCCVILLFTMIAGAVAITSIRKRNQNSGQ